VGKFKAGKSTLVNTMLGSTLAATDLFEMTAWVARYWPSDEAFCRILSRDGTVKETTPSAFVKRCQARLFSAEELNNIVAVDIGSGPSPTSVTLIDAPGSGGMSRDNEKRLVEALCDADLVAWVADVTALGDARESALIQALLAQDTPVIVVLAKCDCADPAEIEEAKSFLKLAYRLGDIPMFPTAAADPKDVGVTQLRDYLNREVTTRHAELRAQAQQSHQARMTELSLRLLERVEGELGSWSQNMDRFTQIARDMCNSVQKQLEVEIEHYVRTKLFDQRRDAITSAMQNSLAEGKGALSQDRIAEVFSGVLGAGYLDAFWANLLEHVQGAGSQLWKEKITNHIKELEECCGTFKDDVVRHIGMQVNEDQIQFQAGEIAMQQAGVVMSGTAVTATIGTAAALGKATFAAALTGVGLPIAATGAVLAATVYYIQRQRVTDAIRAQTHTYLDQCTEEFLKSVVRTRFFPAIDKVNASIGHEMVTALEDGFATRLPEGNLKQLLREVSACRASLV
jgi:ethanolamine utilization protein EutP (predicted NTPase)